MNGNTTDTEQQADPLDEEVLRRRLINRIALAGVAIVALLGGLAIIDSMYIAPSKPQPKVAMAPVLAEAAKSAEPEVKPAEPVAEKVAESEPEVQLPEPPTPEAVPTIKSTAAAEETSSPAAPLPKQPRALTKPAEARQAVVKAAPPQELARQAPATTTTRAPSRPLTQNPQAERRFVLQMGVFNSIENAQELLAKLQKTGVPAQIEARVQVGPFKNKVEADEARAKLKALGMDAGLLMAIHR